MVTQNMDVPEVTPRMTVDAILGAVLALVVALVPVPAGVFLGGALAGGLEGPDLRDAATVGALCGLFAFVLFVALDVYPWEGRFMPARALGWLVVLLVYALAFGALGGAGGGYIRERMAD